MSPFLIFKIEKFELIPDGHGSLPFSSLWNCDVDLQRNVSMVNNVSGPEWL